MTKFPSMKISNYFLVGLGIILVLYFGKNLIGKFTSRLTPSETANKIDQQKGKIQTYTSVKGSFAIDLPSDIKMIEKPERLDDGIIKGEVWFAFSKFDDNAPNGLVVVYEKPAINGKGGACVDEQGKAGYKKETIAGQSVDVCEVGEFRAEYFTHPTKRIEYSVATARLNADQIRVVSEAVRKTLKFTD